MNIIVDGVDGTFKSTVAKKLSDKLGFELIKGSNFESATGTNQQLYEHFMEVNSHNNVVIDRNVFSNLVYASLYEGYQMVTPSQYKDIIKKINSNAIVVYLTAPVDIIVDRIQTRGDEYIQGEYEEIQKISKKYIEVMTAAVKDGVEIRTFDTSVLSSDEIVKQLMVILKELMNKEDAISSGDIVCKGCGKKVLRKNSYFNMLYCPKCYETIMTELLN